MRQEDLAARCGRWARPTGQQETVSRFVKGSRALTLEDTLVLAASLEVPVVRLLHGDDTVKLNGSEVPAGQVRDVLLHGRVQSDHANGSVLDALAVGEARETTAVEQQVADTLQTTVEKVVDASYRLWKVPPDDRLERRLMCRVVHGRRWVGRWRRRDRFRRRRRQRGHGGVTMSRTWRRTSSSRSASAIRDEPSGKAAPVER